MGETPHSTRMMLEFVDREERERQKRFKDMQSIRYGKLEHMSLCMRGGGEGGIETSKKKIFYSTGNWNACVYMCMHACN